MNNINSPDINEVEGLYSARFNTYVRNEMNSSVDEPHEATSLEALNQITQNNMVFSEDNSIKTI